MEFDKDIRMKEEQRKDLMRQAEQYRLVKLALASRPPRDSIWRQLIHWFGDKLVDIVCFLLRQYGEREHTSSDIPVVYPCQEGI
jgi:hypothetical protein